MIPVSVVLPVYNAAEYVGLAIDSILRQTFTDLELIVIDDGSTDQPLDEITSHVGSDLRCKVISRENRGLVESCNEGVYTARGKYIFRMDADDVSHPDRLEAQVRYLEINSDCAAVGTRILLADDELLPIISMPVFSSHGEIDAENMSGTRHGICHPSVAMRRDILISVGGYRKQFEYAEDIDLFLRLAEVGNLANLQETLLTYRQHPKSIGYSKRTVQMKRALMAVQAARDRRALPAGALPPEGSWSGESTDLSRAVASIAGYRSVAEIHRKWAWLALIGGNPATARKHALKALRLDPYSIKNLKLIACAVRGY